MLPEIHSGPNLSFPPISSHFLGIVAHTICSALHPFPVVFANKAWTAITGYEQHEIAGQTLRSLQGPLTNLDVVHDMMNSIRDSGSGDCEIVNYTKSGSPYLAKVQVTPSKYNSHSSSLLWNFFIALPETIANLLSLSVILVNVLHVFWLTTVISKSQDEQYISHYMSVTTASELSEKDKQNCSMIFSLVNAEEYGWLIKTVSDLQSDRDSSDQRSNTSSKDSDDGVGLRRPCERYSYVNGNAGSSSGSDSGSNGHGQRSVSAISSGGTSQEGGSQDGSRNDGDSGSDSGRDRKVSPTNSSDSEKNSSRSNSISLSGSMSTAAEKEGHTSAEGSEMGSVSNAKNTRERRKRKTPPSDDHQVSENNDELPSRTSRTRLSRRFNQSSSRGYKL